MATKKTTAIVPWEQEMADRAVKDASTEKLMGFAKKLSTRGGILTIDDEPLPGNELRVVVVGAVYENQYYTSQFNPNKPTVPVCYAFSEPGSDDPEASMRPNADAEEPQGDEDGACAGCWANMMGSADVGRGKACKNIRRLAVVTEDALESAEAMAEAEVRLLNVPVMSVKNWSKYVAKLSEDMRRPYFGVVTLVKLMPDAKSQFQVTFHFEELVNFDQALYDATKAKVADSEAQLTTPYPKQADLDAAAAAEAKPARGRPAAPAKGGAKAPAKKGKF